MYLTKISHIETFSRGVFLAPSRSRSVFLPCTQTWKLLSQKRSLNKTSSLPFCLILEVLGNTSELHSESQELLWADTKQ